MEARCCGADDEVPDRLSVACRFHREYEPARGGLASIYLFLISARITGEFELYTYGYSCIRLAG